MYKSSNIDQIKVLLGSIFTSGLTWDNSGTLNHKISPLFQAVRDADRLDFALGDPNAKLFEPAIVVFNRLMQIYILPDNNSARPNVIAIQPLPKNIVSQKRRPK